MFTAPALVQVVTVVPAVAVVTVTVIVPVADIVEHPPVKLTV